MKKATKALLGILLLLNSSVIFAVPLCGPGVDWVSNCADGSSADYQSNFHIPLYLEGPPPSGDADLLMDFTGISHLTFVAYGSSSFGFTISFDHELASLTANTPLGESMISDFEHARITGTLRGFLRQEPGSTLANGDLEIGNDDYLLSMVGTSFGTLDTSVVGSAEMGNVFESFPDFSTPFVETGFGMAFGNSSLTLPVSDQVLSFNALHIPEPNAFSLLLIGIAILLLLKIFDNKRVKGSEPPPV